MWRPTVPSKDTIALLIPPTLALFGASVIVVTPAAKLSEEYAFLTLTIVFLYYFPAGRLSTQLESAALTTVGGLLGICSSLFVLQCSVWANKKEVGETPGARAISATGLALLAAFAGYVRSKSPRLGNAARLMLFNSIWLIAGRSDMFLIDSSVFFALFYPMIFAAALSLAATIIGHGLLSPDLATFPGVLLETLHSLERTLQGELEYISGHPRPGMQRTETEGDLMEDGSVPPLVTSNKAARTITTLIPLLRTLYSSHIHSPSIAVLAPERMHEITAIFVNKIGRNSICRGLGDMAKDDGNAAGPGEEGKGKGESLGPSMRELGKALRMSLRLAKEGVWDANGWSPKKPYAPPTDEKSTLVKLDLQADVLSRSIMAYEHELLLWLDGDLLARYQTGELGGGGGLEDPSPVDISQGNVHWTTDYKHKKPGAGGYRKAFRLVALLDISKDILALLRATHQLLEDAESAAPRTVVQTRPRKFRWSKFGWEWFRIRPLHSHWVDEGDEDWGEREDPNALQRQQTIEGMAELVLQREQLNPNPSKRLPGGFPKHRELGISKHSWKNVWNSETMLRGRISLSRLLGDSGRSRHLRYSFKMAFGVALLSIPGFLPVGTEGRNLFIDSRWQWAIISYMYVLETVTGATIRVGLFRTCGTVTGAIAAYVIHTIVNKNPYGLVVMSTAANIVISYVILKTSVPGVGIVAGITMPPILFSTLLRSNTQEAIVVAALRLLDIEVGIVAAILVNLFVFPSHARTRYLQKTAVVLDQLAKLYVSMSKLNLRPSPVYSPSEHFVLLDQEIERGIAQCRSYAEIQRVEISLLPKPHRIYARLNIVLAQILEQLIEVRTLRISIPRKETVLDVLPLRIDLVSSIYLNIFLVAQSFHSKTALPQFLPMPLKHLGQLSDTIERHLKTRRESTRPASISSEQGSQLTMATSNTVLYALAETEALAALCLSLEELLDIAKSLFGEHAFLTFNHHPVRGIIQSHPPGHPSYTIPVKSQ